MFRWYLLMIILSIAAIDIGISTVPNLSVIKSGNSHYCTITNDNSSSALLWNYQNIDETPSSNVYCNVDENNRCTIENLGTWQWINDKNVSPILDYRWENFDAVQLIDNLQKVYETNEKNFRISFSVKIKEVHIILCEGDILNHSKDGNCYWITFGANHGKKNYIRKCDASVVPPNARDFPTDENCVVRQVEFVGEIINGTQWNHFTVSKQENTITVWNYGRSEPILKYTDRSQEVFTTKYVFARRSYSDNAYFMKIHEVKIFPINEPSAAVTIQLTDRYTVETNCLALYVKSCKGCSFNVNLSSKYKVLKQMTIKSLGDDWQEILLRDENNFTEIKEITLKTDSEIQDKTEKPYWHISNTIRKCGSTDFAMKKGDRDGCCYALKYPDQKICTENIKDTPNEGDWTCPANTIGKSCIPCTSIPGRRKCDYSKMCEWTSDGSICSCAPGYQGIDCKSICSSGRYGFNCRMECARCAVTCNYIDGTCSSCERNFEGATCQAAILPLLKNAPKINEIGHTNVAILANMEYEGTQVPYLYEILYKENDGIWIQHGQLMSYSKSRQSYFIYDLKPSTKYKIKIFLQTSNGSKYDGNFVPETDFETTCADIAANILQMKVTNTSITLTVDVNKPQYEETCLISQYRLSVYDTETLYTVYNKQLKIKDTIEPLKPYTNYKIEIRKNNVVILNATLQTKQGVPQPPKSISLQWDNQYGLIIRWQHPDITNGVLREFLLYINDENMASYPVTEENPQYQYKMNISEELTLQKLKIGIASRNSAGDSPLITKSIFSPPKTPKFTGVPNIDDIKNTSFRINIPEISNVEGESSYMYIILTDTRNHVSRDYLQPAERQLFAEINVDADFSRTAGKFDLTDEENRNGFVFKVGIGTETTADVNNAWELTNRTLIPGNTYQVVVILNNTFRDLIRYRTYSLNSVKLLTDSTKLEYFYVLLAIPVLVCVVVFLIKKEYIEMSYICNFTTPRTGPSRSLHEVPLQRLTTSNEIISENMEHSGEMDLKSSQPVRIADLNIYLKNAIREETLVKQYKLISQYEIKSPIDGTKIKSKLKRGFEDTTYDHTKVKLRNPNRKQFTNYINANYIDGYDSEKTFIATVMPKVGNSTNQFWEMICQENVEYIILITNIVQPGRSKFEKYWPDLKNYRDFDKIRVELDKVETNANYEVRYFNISGNRKVRKVQQFYYLTWPDCGLPSHARKLVPFLKRVLGLPQGRSPIVVHCSADVDYTGSLILCNICLRMAAHEGKMDVPSYLSKIRQQRGNMVDDIEQYKLVYLALLQCVSIQNTGILYDESMEEKIEIQMNEKIEEEMKYLDDHAWEDEMELTSNPSVTNKSLSILNSSAGRSSERIDAVAVDSLATQGKFLVTQNPRSGVVGDFWELVAEKQITTIICLNFQNKGSGSSFFPRSTDYPLIPTPQLEVKYVGKDVKTHYVVYILLITRQDGTRQSNTQTKILLAKNWSSDMLCPQSPIDLLMTYEEMNRLGYPDTILITCHDGVRASGLFVAMCFVIDKLKANQLCDVSLAVRTVRRSRREFVRDKEQFSFLYQCVLDYVRQFGLYSTPNN